MAFTEERVARRVLDAALIAALLVAAMVPLGSPARADAQMLPLGERYMPQGVAVDPSTGVIYSGASDGSVCRLLSVNAAGIPRVLAGTGRCDTSGDGGPAIEADVNPPQSVAVDGAGNVFVASGYTVRRVSASTGEITAWAGRDEYTCLVFSWRGPMPRVGAVASEVAFHAADIEVDPISGHLFVLSNCSRKIWEIDESGVVVAGYVGVGTEWWAMSDLAFAPEGDLYFAEGRYGERVFKLDTRGGVTHIAGNGETEDEGDEGPARAAGIRIARAMAVDSHGILYIATEDDLIPESGHRRHDPARRRPALAGR